MENIIEVKGLFKDFSNETVLNMSNGIGLSFDRPIPYCTILRVPIECAPNGVLHATPTLPAFLQQIFHHCPYG